MSRFSLDSMECPDCGGNLHLDPENKVIICTICGRILNRETIARDSKPKSIQNDKKSLMYIKKVISSIKIPRGRQNWRRISIVWGNNNHYQLYDLNRLGKALEVPWTTLERVAVLFKKYIELKIIPDILEENYVERLLIACLVVTCSENGRDQAEMIQELEYYVPFDKGEIETAILILKESINSGF